MRLEILIGAKFSSADYAAQSIQMGRAGQANDMEVKSMAKDALYRIYTTRDGSGDVPDHAKALNKALGAQAALPAAQAYWKQH